MLKHSEMDLAIEHRNFFLKSQTRVGQAAQPIDQIQAMFNTKPGRTLRAFPDFPFQYFKPS